ncbi:superoxide dismutase [Photobacterium phosphoreum]|uniref:superoxide dismutase family protein n=1 Tax=Photobacterium phosphoreum TaxID=659 RepID=UPI000D172DD0|nr:superoxide dismutase family protein [Photobacterium phosphoreum]PSW28018.1 superoxide dismutase [Photobacterium phosphoreum]
MKKILLTALILASASASAADLSIKMTDLNSGAMAGTISAEQTKYGVVFTPHLTGLPTGLHGFHVHVNPSCGMTEKMGKAVLGGAAGGHYDPMQTNKHGYAWTDDNHLGDLPPLYVDIKGNVEQPVLAPRLKLSDLKGRALMIHAGGDNHSDHPKPLGGGGARMVCGVIK